MCLAIPCKILEIKELGSLRAGPRAVRRDRAPSVPQFVPDAQAGDYLMVHVGFAISRVDRFEAEHTYQLLQENLGDCVVTVTSPSL